LGITALVALTTAVALLAPSNSYSKEKEQVEPITNMASAIPQAGVYGTKNERSFIAVKPDGVNRGLVGEIIRRFEQKGFKLVGLKLTVPSKEKAEGHYEEHRGKPFFAGLANFFASGPIVAMVWEGEDIIATGRRMMGATKPKDSAPGTIRGDFAVNMGRNIIHGSDGQASAAKEITYWFAENEIANWNPTISSWLYE
jgi:nucleoside-diphosphate kinase